ncbi:MAG TPA: acyltransferase [Solirubrobacteraceae bacterium]|nr:acyltransferase [Solirubrobacteraceae bacterium]
MAAAAPDALRPPPGNPRFPLLDSMRAIAALSILVTHASGVSTFNVANALGAYTARLNFGVTIFFLLSGFLLYRPFVAARRDNRPPIAIRAFFRRRVLRILPAYWVALSILALWPGLLGFADHWWRFYSFTQIYWANSTVQGDGPAWTLAIEVSFYLSLPLIARGIAALRPSVRGELALIGFGAVCALALRTVLQADGGFNVLQNTLPCYFDWFAYGMILAVLSVAWHGREAQSRALRLIVRRPWLPWLGAAVVFWFMATQMSLSRGFFVVYTNWNYFGEHACYALCAFLLLLPAVFGDWAGGWPRRILAARPLPWLGLVSYGIFLWHAPIMLWLDDRGAQGWLPGSGFLSLMLVTAAIVIPIAAASYYVVERPALRFKDRRTRHRDAALAPPATAGQAG